MSASGNRDHRGNVVRIVTGFLGEGELMTSTYLDREARTKEQTAIDLMKDALRMIMYDCKNLAPSSSQRAERTLNRVKELLA